MIKLQALALALATVIAEVRKTLPMIPVRALKLRGLEEVVFSFDGDYPIAITCTDPNGIKARIECFNNVLTAVDHIKKYRDNPVSITLKFGASRGYLTDTYFIG